MVEFKKALATILALSLGTFIPGGGFSVFAAESSRHGQPAAGTAWRTFVFGASPISSAPSPAALPVLSAFKLTTPEQIEGFVGVMERTGLDPQAVAAEDMPVEQKIELVRNSAASYAAGAPSVDSGTRAMLQRLTGSIVETGIAWDDKKGNGPAPPAVSGVDAGKETPRLWRLRPSLPSAAAPRAAAVASGLAPAVEPQGSGGLRAAAAGVRRLWSGILSRRSPPAASAAASNAFFDPRHGLRADLYVALVQHILDLEPAQRENYRRRYLAALGQSSEAFALEMRKIAEERMKEGFPFEPARLDPFLNRQTGSAEQAFVEQVNNGFDAMGDPVGRFAVGVFQAIGRVEKDGESLTYRSVSKQDPRRAYSVRFHRANGQLWIQPGNEPLARDRASGTDAILQKRTPLDTESLRAYLDRKLAVSRRGRVIERTAAGDRLVNDLSAYRTVAGKPVPYRLPADAEVVLELGADGRRVRVVDRGRGLTPQAAVEALSVPGVSTNRTGAELAAAARVDAKPREELIFYREGPPNKSSGKVAFLVGGTEVETLDIAGESLAPVVVLDLPAESYQKEARSQIILDESTVASIRRLLDETMVSFQKDPARLAPVVNSLVAALSQLENSHRIRSVQEKDNLSQHLKNAVKASLDGLTGRFVAVPALAEDIELEPAALAGRKEVRLDVRLWDFDPATVGGRSIPGTGKNLWAVRMRRPFARVGERTVILSEDLVDRYSAAAAPGQGPVLLNLIFGVWLGYGERPTPEAVMAPRIRTTESPDRGAAADPLQISWDGSVARARGMLQEFPGLSPELRGAVQPLLVDALRAGQGEAVLRRKLSRLAHVAKVVGEFSAEALDALAFEPGDAPEDIIVVPGGGNLAAAVSFGGQQIKHELFRLTADGFRPIHGPSPRFRLGLNYAPKPEGEYSYFSFHTPDFNLFRIRDERAEPVPDFHGRAERAELLAVGERVFLSILGDDDFSIFELKEGLAVPFGRVARRAPDQTVVDVYDFGGRVFVRVRGGFDLDLYEINGSKAEHIVFPNRGFIEEPRLIDGRVLVNADPGAFAYEIKDGRARAVRLEGVADEAIRRVYFKVGRIFVQTEIGGAQSLYEVRGVRARKIADLPKFSMRDVSFLEDGRMYLISSDRHSLYEIRDGKMREVPGFPDGVTIQDVQSVGGRVIVNQYLAGRGGQYEIIAGRAHPLEGPDGLMFHGSTGMHGGRIFGEDSGSGRYELRGRTWEKIEAANIRFFDVDSGESVLVFRHDADRPWLRRDLRNPLANIRDAASSPAPGWPADLNLEEKSQLARNLLSLGWSEDLTRALGWALPWTQSRVLERLDQANRGAWTGAIRGLLHSRQRVAMDFLNGAHGALPDDRAYNAAVGRWLRVFKADPARALELAAALAGRWDELGPDGAPDASPLVLFLRGDKPLEPLALVAAAPTRVSQGAVAGVALSALAGARANLSIVSEKGHDLTVKDLGRELPRRGYPQTETAIERGLGAEAGHEWIREGVQNAAKAATRSGQPMAVEIRSGVRQVGDKTQLVVNTRDRGDGMDVYGLVHDLLPLGRSSAAEDSDSSLGFNGRGWYKYLVGSDRVRVVSGKRGARRHVSLDVYMERAAEAGPVRRAADLRELPGNFEGTEVEWMREKAGSLADNRLGFELEAALIADSLETYCGALGERGVQVNYNGRSILERVEERGSVSWSGGEQVRVVRTSSGKRRILQGGFFVMDLDQDPDLWALVPEELRRFAREERLSLDLPRSLPLDSERDGLAGKEAYRGRLQKAVFAAVSKAAARSMADGRWSPRELSKDYAYRARHDWSWAGSRAAAARELADNVSGDDWDRVEPRSVQELLTQEGGATTLAHYLAAVALPWRDSLLSLAGLRERLLAAGDDARKVAHSELPAGYAALAREAVDSYSALLTDKKEDDHWVYEDAGALTPEQRHARRLLAALIEGVMTPLVRQNLGAADARYAVTFGEAKSPRMAMYGKNWISLSVRGASSWLKWVDDAAAGKTSPEEDYRRLFEIVETVVHEDAHAWEPRSMETHNAEFLERMRASLLRLAALGVVPEQALERLRRIDVK